MRLPEEASNGRLIQHQRGGPLNIAQDLQDKFAE